MNYEQETEVRKELKEILKHMLEWKMVPTPKGQEWKSPIITNGKHDIYVGIVWNKPERYDIHLVFHGLHNYLKFNEEIPKSITIARSKTPSKVANEILKRVYISSNYELLDACAKRKADREEQKAKSIRTFKRCANMVGELHPYINNHSDKNSISFNDYNGKISVNSFGNITLKQSNITEKQLQWVLKVLLEQ